MDGVLHPLEELVRVLSQRALTGGSEDVWEAVREEKTEGTAQAK